MNSKEKKALGATGILTGILLWFVGGVVLGSTGVN